MYIPIGPSKKQLYKLLFLMFICLISLTMFKGCIKALEFTDLTDITPTSLGSGNFVSQSGIFGTSSNTIVFTNSYNISIYDTIPDYMVFTGYASMYTLSSPVDSQTNKYYTDYLFKYSRITITTEDNKEYLCDNYFDKGYAICPNPKKRVTNVTLQLLVSNLESNARIEFNSAFFPLFYYANRYKADTNSIANSSSQTANNTAQINSSINDSNVDNNSTNNTISNLASGIHSNGTITNLLTLPITFLQQLVNGFNGSCSPFVIGTLWGTDISLSCINISSFGAIFNIVDIFVSGFLAYAFGCKMIKLFNKFTNMKEGGLEQAYD